MTEDNIDAIDLKTAARRVGVCWRTMHRLVSTGELKSIKIGRRRVVRIEALRAYLDSRETSASNAE
jgi:excisionase family DNA binding protein